MIDSYAVLLDCLIDRPMMRINLLKEQGQWGTPAKDGRFAKLDVEATLVHPKSGFAHHLRQGWVGMAGPGDVLGASSILHGQG